jgi:hypothetical protein
MRRLLTLASMVATTGLLCGAALVGTTAVAGASTSTSASATHAEPGGPMIHANGAKAASTGAPTVSLNWSGYAVTSNKKFTYVHSTFVQPAVTCTGVKNEWTSDWTGLDGYSSNTVEQDGTFARCAKGGTKPVYKAWYEMFPENSVNVFAVHAGDIMDSSVTYAGGTFSLTISDLTTGKSVTKNATCATCERTSAEWIIERPALCNNAGTNCFITKLANFGTSTMVGDQAQLTGGKVKGIGSFSNIPIDMVTPLKKGGFISLDTVGPVSGKSFTATWDRAGHTVPITF